MASALGQFGNKFPQTPPSGERAGRGTVRRGFRTPDWRFRAFCWLKREVPKLLVLSSMRTAWLSLLLALSACTPQLRRLAYDQGVIARRLTTISGSVTANDGGEGFSSMASRVLNAATASTRFWSRSAARAAASVLRAPRGA
jgi:hypothetical protein